MAVGDSLGVAEPRGSFQSSCALMTQRANLEVRRAVACWCLCCNSYLNGRFGLQVQRALDVGSKVLCVATFDCGQRESDRTPTAVRISNCALTSLSGCWYLQMLQKLWSSKMLTAFCHIMFTTLTVSPAVCRLNVVSEWYLTISEFVSLCLHHQAHSACSGQETG